ncbi:unnamed protein product [Pleuronectes platessa]|uniref:Uncharacterized protein n=1 Tax=Pleuronectes platessa TaxID=8262 RepID=A0A9N7UGM2_PLEPL|nr:unnamed protein product [Pleuronectes platessa]
MLAPVSVSARAHTRVRTLRCVSGPLQCQSCRSEGLYLCCLTQDRGGLITVAGLQLLLHLYVRHAWTDRVCLEVMVPAPATCCSPSPLHSILGVACSPVPAEMERGERREERGESRGLLRKPDLFQALASRRAEIFVNVLIEDLHGAERSTGYFSCEDRARHGCSQRRRPCLTRTANTESSRCFGEVFCAHYYHSLVAKRIHD